MKRILFISTGGTIASENQGEGLTPVLTSHALLNAVPEVYRLAEIDTCELYHLDSSNLRPAHWVGMAEAIVERYDAYDGFVISHGTDTMAYTAAALSYMIADSVKPIVLTGAQKSLAVSDGDARRNLLDAFRYAVSDIASGVHIVFDGKVILGTRAKKTRTKSFNAFSSVDFPESAVIRDGRVIPFLTESPTQTRFAIGMKESVFVLKLVPGLSVDIFDYLFDRYDALVIESFGVGGIPYYESDEFSHAIERWVKAGKTIVMTTQVQHEGSDMGIYQVGHTIKKRFALLEAYSMTLEAVYTKLMWILAQTTERDSVRTLFKQPIAHDRI